MLSPEDGGDDLFLYTNGSENGYIWDNSTNTTDEPSLSVPHPNVLLPYSVLLGIAIYLTIVGMFWGISGLLSTFGNILFILTVIRWRYLRNNSHMLLLLNMAVADLAISITGYPYTTISGYIGKWIFGPIMCQLYAFLCFTFSQVSINTLVTVSIFRYIAVCHPHLKHFLTSRTSMFALGIVWSHALFWTITPLLGWSSYTFEPTRISCSFDWNDRTFGGVTYVIGTTLFCYLSHIIVLVWCYRRIFHMVYSLKSNTRHRNHRFKKVVRNTTTSTLGTSLSDSNVGNQQQLEHYEDNPPDSPQGLPRCQSLIVFSFTTENLTEMELHVLGMNIAMVVAFTTFWTPYAIICISAFYDKLSPFWYIFPTIFAKTSCMINPILYGLTNSFLRKQLLLVLRGFLGLTTAIEDFQVMRQRQQDGLYNKEGIFVGKRSGAITHCPCEGCVASRRQIKFLIEKEKTEESASISQATIEKPESATTAQQQIDHEKGLEQLPNTSRKDKSCPGEDENTVNSSGLVVLLSGQPHLESDEDDESKSQQRHPSPMSLSRGLSGNEFQQSLADTEGHHCNSNAIILSPNTLFKDVDGKRKGMLLASEGKYNEI